MVLIFIKLQFTKELDFLHQQKLHKDIRMDHLTFEGGGGVEELVCARIVFSLVSGAGNFFRAVHAFFFIAIRVA